MSWRTFYQSLHTQTTFYFTFLSASLKYGIFGMAYIFHFDDGLLLISSNFDPDFYRITNWKYFDPDTRTDLGPKECRIICSSMLWPTNQPTFTPPTSQPTFTPPTKQPTVTPTTIAPSATTLSPLQSRAC